MQRWMANIICAFVWDTKARDKLRTRLRFDTRWCFDFVREYIHDSNAKLSSYVGYGCRNFIIVVNKTNVFKFPVREKKGETSFAEKRITDYFEKKSPVKIPHVEIVKVRDRYVKVYDYVDGIMIDDADPKLVQKNIDKIAEQIADFLLTLSVDDPKELLDLKPNKKDKPGFMYGWGHRDIGGNFVLDKKTMDVIGFIDWEMAGFGDLMPDFEMATHHWNKLGLDRLGVKVLAAYAKKYQSLKK